MSKQIVRQRAALPRLIAQLGTAEPVELWRATPGQKHLPKPLLHELTASLGPQWTITLIPLLPDFKAIGRLAMHPDAETATSDDSDLVVEDLREYKSTQHAPNLSFEPPRNKRLT